MFNITRRRNAEDYSEKLRALQQKRTEIEKSHRKDERSYSLVGLRLSALLNQLQAVQALQGLQELTPKEKGPGRRFDISEDPKERATHRQWLAFKADWLESLLEDAVDELRLLDEYEEQQADLTEHEKPQNGHAPAEKAHRS